MGVDGQTSQSFIRRFQYKRPDGLFAVVTKSHYVVSDLTLIARTDFVVCRDLEDVEGSAISIHTDCRTLSEFTPKNDIDAVGLAGSISGLDHLDSTPDYFYIASVFEPEDS